MTRLRRQDSAQILWNALAAVAPKGLTKWQLRQTTGLTEGQFNYALAYIRDYLLVNNSQPLAVDKGWPWTYRLPDSWLEQRPYVNFRAGILLTMAQRLTNAVTASDGKWPNDPQIRLIRRDLRRLVEDLEDLTLTTV